MKKTRYRIRSLGESYLISHHVPSRERISVVILNWNGLRFLGPCIMSLMEQTKSPDEIVLVDNGSTDGSVEYVKRNFPSVRILENDRNLGFAEGMNVGIRSAAGDYVIALNNDTHVPQNFVEVLSDCASRDHAIGSVSCKMFQEQGVIWYGPMFTNNGFLVPLFMGNNLLPKRIEKLFDMDAYCMTNCAAAVLYRKDALKITGGFDSDFRFDWEDHDLSFRLWSAGYKNCYTTKTSAAHLGGGSFGVGLSRERYARIIRNMLFTYVKNYGAMNLATRFLFVMWILIPFRHMTSIIVYELKRRIKGSSKVETFISREAYLSIPQAYFQFLLGLRTVMQKRVKIQKNRKIPDSVIFSLTSRPWII